MTNEQLEQQNNELRQMVTDLAKHVSSLVGVMSMQQISPIIPTCTYTYSEWLLKWFDLYKKPKNQSRSARDMLSRINNYIIPALGNYSVAVLTGEILQTFVNNFPKTNTLLKVTLIINESLQKLVDLGQLPRNPFASVDLPSFKSKHYKPLEFVQQTIMLNMIENNFYYSVFWFLNCTGLRVSEFLALDWENDIDYKLGVIRVTKAMDITSQVIKDSTKSESGTRNVPFIPALKRHIAVIKDYAKVKPITYNMLKCYFRKIYNRLNYTDLNIHSFRHTFVSMCYAARIPDKVIQTWAGHSGIEVTLNIYTHLLTPGTSFLYEYITSLRDFLGYG